MFRQVKTYLTTGVAVEPPSIPELRDIIVGHLEAIHACYGEDVGVRVARKHIGWYLQGMTPSRRPPLDLLTATSAAQQLDLLEGFLAQAVGSMCEAA
jgi:tRNA-dihydrouridine synthase B